MLRVLCLTKYGVLGASSRLRFYQYIERFNSEEFSIDVAPLLSDQYIKGLYDGKIPWRDVLRGYTSRLYTCLKFNQYDIVWLEKELFPKIPDAFELSLLPREVKLVVDYDDAIFHQYDQHPSALIRKVLGKKIDAVMNRADLVIVGSLYLAERARSAGAKSVELLPTVVDTYKYNVVKSATQINNKVTIGWIGSPVTATFLKLIAPVIKKISAIRNVCFVVVGANSSQLSGLPIKLIPWSAVSEVTEIQKFDIGIMPLPNAPFERGKCGYKLIQYMACGKPVIASPVGANQEIVRHEIDGYLAYSEREWIEFLLTLIDDKKKRHEMGMTARRRVEEKYSLKITVPRLRKLFIDVVS